MTWLSLHIWMLLAAAGLLGLVLGIALRGVVLRARLRRMQVERDLARTEIDQARNEIEALYAAQRRAGQPDDALRAELTTRKSALERMSGELDSARAELARLQADAGSTGEDVAQSGAAVLAGAAIGAAGASALGSDVQEAGSDGVSGQAAALEWRNRYLESRVQQLETELREALTASRVLASAEPVSVSDDSGISPEATDTVTVSEDTGAVAGEVLARDTADTDKLRWQNQYLAQRLSYFEGKVAALPVVAEALDDVRETPDEELARLRWRNRYLEGRLAYLEEEHGAASVPSSVSGEDVALQALAPAVETPAAPTLGVETAPAEAVEDTVPVDGEHPADQIARQLGDDQPVEAEVEVIDPSLDDLTLSVEPAPEPEPEPEPVSVQEPEPDAAPEQVSPPEPESEIETLADEGADSSAASGDDLAQPVRPPALETSVKDGGDDLTQIEGIGPRIREVLNGLGIWKFEQIAAWDEANARWIDEELNFSGRVSRQDWVGQAERILAGAAQD